MSTVLGKSPAIAALLLSVFVLAACGESAQEKAQAQVCNARTDISKEITAITELKVSTNVFSEATTHFDAIATDLSKIKNAQTNLAPARKEQVEAATHTFTTEFSSIVSGLSSNLSLSNAEAHLKTALAQLATTYKKALAPISCS
jgi:Tfp pilus assembly protein PilP